MPQWAKIKILVNCVPLEAIGKNPFLSLCGFYRLYKFLCLLPPSKPAVADGVFLMLLHSDTDSLVLLFHLCRHVGPTQIIQDNCPYFKGQLISNLKSICKLNFLPSNNSFTGSGYWGVEAILLFTT